jgi:hypothetical protein
LLFWRCVKQGGSVLPFSLDVGVVHSRPL